jgi:heme-binding NEAT domain protein
MYQHFVRPNGELYVHVTVHHNRFVFNQPDALIIQIYCCKTLHVSGIFSAHHQEFSTIHSALVIFMQELMTASKQSQDGTAHENYQCRMYGRELMMGQRG